MPAPTLVAAAKAAGPLPTPTQVGSTVVVSDTKGDMAHVTIADVKQSNGVIHVVDHVLLPK